MTLEEAIIHCKEKVCGNTQCALEHRQLAEWLQELQAMKSLPSNLDEAAIRVANEMEIPTEHSQPESLTLIMRHIATQMFKSGAEWMAGQFRKIEGRLLDWYETDGIDYCCGISTNDAFEVPEGFYIRKK